MADKHNDPVYTIPGVTFSAGVMGGVTQGFATPGAGVTDGFSMQGVIRSWPGWVVTQGLLPLNAKKLIIAAIPKTIIFSMGCFFKGLMLY